MMGGISIPPSYFKRGVMVNIRTVEYEYKMISSFFDNYKKIHIYDEIKEVVLGIKKANEVKNGLEILKMHRFLILAIGSTINISIKSILNLFSFVFGNKALIRLKYCYGQRINRINLKHYTTCFQLLDLSKNEKELLSSYFLFVLAGILMNYHFNDYVVVPVYLFDNLEKIKDEQIKACFLDGLIRNSLKKHKNDLKEKIFETYQKNALYFISNGIKNVWLFGSISKDQYNDFSDIDIVIDCENNKNVPEALSLISKFNKEHFDRKSDVHFYEDFIEHNPTIKLLKLI